MSICPDDTLHHLYVDGEIPSEHLSTYKQHADSCPACQSKIQRINALKNRLHADSAVAELCSGNLDESFGQLMTKMKFRTVSREIRKNETSFLARKTLPWAAAIIITLSGAYVFLQTGVSARFLPVRGSRNTASVSEENFPQEEDAPPGVLRDSAGIAIPVGMLENARRHDIASAYAVYDPQSISAENALPSIPDFDVFRPRSLYPKTGLRVYLFNRDGSYKIVISGKFTFSLDSRATDSVARNDE
jgi:hypothetical protein